MAELVDSRRRKRDDACQWYDTDAVLLQSVHESVGRYICTKPSQRALVRRTLKQLIPLHGLFAHLHPLCYSNSQPYTYSARIEDEGH